VLMGARSCAASQRASRRRLGQTPPLADHWAHSPPTPARLPALTADNGQRRAASLVKSLGDFRLQPCCSQTRLS
jgi:hypothetical protein